MILTKACRKLKMVDASVGYVCLVLTYKLTDLVRTPALAI